MRNDRGREDGWQPGLVFDVGVHTGEDSEFYLALGYRVVGVEANPELCALLSKKFADRVPGGQFVLAPYAVSDKGGEVVFYVNRKRSVWGTVDSGWARRNRKMGAESEEIRVPAIRFAELLRRHGCPYYLKIDIEGADMQCIYALREIAARPRYLSIESAKTSWDDLLEEFRVLEELGYRRFQVIDQRLHPQRTGRFIGPSAQLVDWSFKVGSSGAFGEHLGGTWVSRDEAIAQYRRIFFWYRWFGDNTIGWRIAKKIPGLREFIRQRVSWYDTHAMHG